MNSYFGKYMEALDRFQQERSRRERAEAELGYVASVIERAGTYVIRNGRDMHEWLAQVLQVLIAEREIAKELAVRPEVVRSRQWCRFAGPGRGDCLHFVGVPEKLDQTTTDEYGIPHGWCEYCWLSYQFEQAQQELVRLRDPEGMMGLTVADNPPTDWSSRRSAMARNERIYQLRLSRGGKIMPCSDQEYLDRAGRK